MDSWPKLYVYCASDVCRSHHRLDGPVLTPTDLYLLQTELELHPILMGVSVPNFVFNLSTGASAMFNAADRERDLPFTKASPGRLI